MVEKSQEIRILPMNITYNEIKGTTNFKWRLKLKKDRLLHKYLSTLMTKPLDFIFKQINLLGYFG